VTGSQFAAGTIVTPDRLPWARALWRSFAEHHPQVPFAVVALGEPDPSALLPDDGFELLGPAALGLDEREYGWMRAIYDGFELSCAVKPWLLRHLLAEVAPAAVYLDADILVCAPLDALAQRAARSGVLLTPHLLDPPAGDGAETLAANLLRLGQFNAGFVAVGRSGIPFLRWWGERLRRDCVDHSDEEPLRFVDQRWLDLAINCFQIEVLRARGANVAYWNVGSRLVTRDARGYAVDGEPLLFMHFSGFDPKEPGRLSRHAHQPPRVDADGTCAVGELCALYAQLLARAGLKLPPAPAQGLDAPPAPAHSGPELLPTPAQAGPELSASPAQAGSELSASPAQVDPEAPAPSPAPSPQPSLPGGLSPTPAARRALRAALVEAERVGPRAPDPRDDAAVLEWLRAPMTPAGTSRYLWALRASRRALRERFPAVPGPDEGPLQRWSALDGLEEGLVEPALAGRATPVALDRERPFVVLVHADEALADPALLEGVATVLAPDAGALLLFAPGWEAGSFTCLMTPVLRQAGLEEPGAPDALGVLVAAAGAALAPLVDVVLTRRPPAAGLECVPHVGDARGLRSMRPRTPAGLVADGAFALRDGGFAPAGDPAGAPVRSARA